MRTRATISIDGVPVVMHGPADAARLGIGIIHQELEVIDTLDVAGNVFLGREPHWAGPLRLLDRRRMEAETERQLARIGAQISPRTVVGRLSTAQKQFVAIARALSMNARLLVLDEPTASLGSSEAERLFAVLQDLRIDRHRDRVHLASVEGNRGACGPRRRAAGRPQRGRASARRADARSTRAVDGGPCDRERASAAASGPMRPPEPRRRRLPGCTSIVCARGAIRPSRCR